MVYPEGLECAICGHPIVSCWLPDKSAGLCGKCMEKAPSLLLRLLAIVRKYAETEQEMESHHSWIIADDDIDKNFIKILVENKFIKK